MHIPYYKQKFAYTCGPAVMRMVLEALGISRTEEQLAQMLHTSMRIGTPNRMFSRVFERFKFSYTVGRHGRTHNLIDLLRKKHLIIVCYFYPPEKVGHFAVVKKIANRKIYLLDPAAGPEVTYRTYEFARLWNKTGMFDREKGWLIAVKPE